MERRTRLPNESVEYLAKREELRLAEIESMKLRERVAELRRQLPQGAIVQDYSFIEGPADLDAGDAPTKTVRLSDLFTGPDRSVVIYQFMYGKRQTKPCPMCSLVIDSLNGVAHHMAQNVDVAIVAAADPPALRGHARRRAGIGCDSLAPVKAPSSMTWAVKTGKAIRIRPYRFSRRVPMAPLGTSTARIREWRQTSKNAGSIFCFRSTTF